MQQLQLAPRGRGARLHPQNRVVERRLDARLVAPGLRCVDHLKVESKDQGLAHAPIGKLRAAGVHDEAFNARGALMWDEGFHHLPRLHRREVILIGPFRSIGFAIGGDLSGFEGFKHHAAIAEVIIAQRFDVVATLVEGQILAPPIRVLGEFDEPSGLKARDDIGASANRNL